uniref:Branched-chain-amino-acid aminotransferase n=1 Tax=Panagrellus redivivus TaxID=6233 RepID=A0A7E4VJC3_PANRE
MFSLTSRHASKLVSSVNCPHQLATRAFSVRNLQVIQNPNSGADKAYDGAFGVTYTDHMFEADWCVDKGWSGGLIKPFENLSLHPGSKVLHYAIELFEGIKAYRGDDGKVRIFRLDQNMNRMLRTAKRAGLPDFDPKELAKCIQRLISQDYNWVPSTPQGALYIRPTLISTDPQIGVSAPLFAKLFVILSPMTGSYFGGTRPRATLLADPKYIRAWAGGVGSFKMGCNYAPTFQIGAEAAKYDCNQVLWLYGQEELITEVGTMNIFAYFRKPNGKIELATPGLDRGIILPGVVRSSIIDLAREYKEVEVVERDITMAELKQTQKDGSLLGIFGTGTAVGITPVNTIKYREKDGSLTDIQVPLDDTPKSLPNRLLKELLDIQYGRVKKPEWQFLVEPL